MRPWCIMMMEWQQLALPGLPPLLDEGHLDHLGLLQLAADLERHLPPRPPQAHRQTQRTDLP